MSHDDRKLSVSQIAFPNYVSGNKWPMHAQKFLNIAFGRDEYLLGQNYVRSMRRYHKLVVVILCANAIASAASGTFVDITWYFYLALAFAFVNLVCSIFFLYGMVIRLHLLMLPYITCICINFVQCMCTFILTFRGQGMEKGKAQVYVFLGYLGLWLLIIPAQLFVTICYLVKSSKKKAKYEKFAPLRIVISEEFRVPPPPVFIPLKGPLSTRASIQNVRIK